MANNHSVESQVSGTPVMLFQTPIALIVSPKTESN